MFLSIAWPMTGSLLATFFSNKLGGYNFEIFRTDFKPHTRCFGIATFEAFRFFFKQQKKEFNPHISLANQLAILWFDGSRLPFVIDAHLRNAGRFGTSKSPYFYRAPHHFLGVPVSPSRFINYLSEFPV